LREGRGGLESETVRRTSRLSRLLGREKRAESVEVIGVYPVEEAEEPCHQIEMVIRGSPGFDPGELTQEIPGRRKAYWQVAFHEHVLTPDGQTVIRRGIDIPGGFEKHPELLEGDVRFVFFFYYVYFSRPLRTPFGEVPLPPPSERPARLKAIEYLPP
jgi:hypothetical protein